MKESCRRFYFCLPGNEREKADRFIREEDRLRFIAGRLMIRTLASEKLGTDAPEILLTEYGKPYIPAADGFHFNISHSGDLVVLAVSDAPVGVDIEQEVPTEWIELSKTFAAKEREILKKADDPLKCFYRIWTVCEAFSKAVGKGLSLFDEEMPDIDLSHGTVDYRGMTLFFDCRERDGYHLSVCGSTMNLSTEAKCFLTKI